MITMKDCNSVLSWSKNDIFCSANGWVKNRSSEEIYNWWARYVNTPPDDFIRMGIEANANKGLIGYVDLACIKDKTAELGIAIGETTLWGKGIGYQAAICMMSYGSINLGITTYYAETHESNTRSRRMLEKIGYKEISRNGMEEYLGKNDQLIQYEYNVKEKI
ncbi:GNAT family N-acetyltransferase [Paenibacillus puldeungensis]